MTTNWKKDPWYQPWLGPLVVCLSILALALSCERARAEGLWLVATTQSYHADRKAEYNERNYGVGGEYQFNKDIAAVAGEYKNSFGNKSTYFGVLYTPFVAGPFKAGIMAVDISGYILDKPRAFTFAAAPMVVWEGERFGANLLFVPPLGNGTGVFGLQLKVKFSEDT